MRRRDVRPPVVELTGSDPGYYRLHARANAGTPGRPCQAMMILYLIILVNGVY